MTITNARPAAQGDFRADVRASEHLKTPKIVDAKAFLAAAKAGTSDPAKLRGLLR